MRILSNGFPTNLPDSEKVSQGGPANFARLFITYLLTPRSEHEWIGVMLEAVPGRGATALRRIFAVPQRRYYRLRMPKARLWTVTKAKKPIDPEKAWSAPLELLIKLIREQKPDVVFLNGFGLLNWMLLKAAERTGTPVVIQHAGIWTKELRVHKDLYTREGRAIMERMEKDSTRLATFEVFLNAWSKDYYRTHVAQAPEAKTRVIPLPFDFASFGRLSRSGNPGFSFDPACRHIGIIGRWDEIKNHKAVLALAKEARRKQLPWQFHSIVDIPDSSKYRAARTAYERFVHVIPPTDRAGISEFCRSIDLLLLPSIFDVSPTVVLEAIASDTPIVISSNVGYVHDFFTYGAQSWVIDPGDTAAAVRALHRLMGKTMPDALKKYLRSSHDHKRVFAEYLALFEKARARATKGGLKSLREFFTPDRSELSTA